MAEAQLDGIGTLEPADLPRLIELELACFPEDAWSANALLSTVEDQYIIAGCWRSDKVVQAYYFLHILDDDAQLYSIAVAKEAQRQGLGNRLMTSIIGSCRKNGARRIFLEVRKSNHKAIYLYEKWGFEVLGVRRGYYHDNGEDALVYRKELA
jgi:ribosomal-protein-alanine N-acetyltransferase